MLWLFRQLRIVIQLPLDLLDALFRRWQILRHRSAQLFDGFADFSTDLIMRFVRGCDAFYFVPPQFLVCLRRAEEICSQFRTSHMIQNFLRFLEPLTRVDFFCAKSAIQSLI